MSAVILEWPIIPKPRPRPIASAEQFYTRIMVANGLSQDEAERRAHELAMNMLRQDFGAGEC